MQAIPCGPPNTRNVWKREVVLNLFVQYQAIPAAMVMLGRSKKQEES